MVKVFTKFNGMEFYACKSVNHGTIHSQFLKNAQDRIDLSIETLRLILCEEIAPIQ